MSTGDILPQQLLNSGERQELSDCGVGTDITTSHSIHTLNPDFLPTLSVADESFLALEASDLRAETSISQIRREYEEIRRQQQNVSPHVDGSPRCPEKADFLPQISMTMKLITPVLENPVKHCVILLHDSGGNETTLKTLALRLQQEQKDSVFILLRGIHAVTPPNSGYHWADTDKELDGGFLATSRALLNDVIKETLMAKCHFRPREIIIFGHSQGGTASLAAAATWNEVELGGTVSVGGPMPDYAQLLQITKAKTPALVLGGALGAITATALQTIRDSFVYVDPNLGPNASDEIPGSDKMVTLSEFFAHRLRREEWTKQSVISFDGGGIRGYGSLLVLRELMNKIGDEEKRLGNSESSFAPHEYKPKLRNPTVRDAEDAAGYSLANTSNPPDQLDPAIRPSIESHDLDHTDDPRHSPFFLPCHYFTYAAGTSTGGLISIMLARFRMTVDDCIEEYKTLGQEIFGHPRPFAKGAILWHKYSHRALESVIEKVTKKYSEESEFSVNYPMDEDVCRCIVLAYADYMGADAPYLFRTYGTSAPAPHNSGSHDPTNYGEPPRLPIWQVARATSAAPGYFPEIKIPRGNDSGFRRFKDGGFGSNNPSHDAYKDIVNKHGGMHSTSIGPFVSIGTGDSNLDMFAKKPGNPRRAWTNLKTAIKLPPRSNKAHLNMQGVSRHDKKQVFPYYRFDGGEALGKIAMDAWEGGKFNWITRRGNAPGYKTLAAMEAATAVYLQDRRIQKELEKCAQDLVRRRRLRMRDDSAWDRFASFSYYECDIEGCQKPRLDTADDLEEHIRNIHRVWIADRDMNEKLKRCRRIYWVYRSESLVSKSPVAGT